MDAHALGRHGERLAVDYYRDRGFRIVSRNYRCRLGEIDLVVRRGRLIVFCEVKTRASAMRGAPYEAVDPRKQARLRRLAAHWLAARRPGRVEIRFDVISAVVEDGAVSLQHFSDAF
jgi:putative endonuclease